MDNDKPSTDNTSDDSLPAPTTDLLKANLRPSLRISENFETKEYSPSLSSGVKVKFERKISAKDPAPPKHTLGSLQPFYKRQVSMLVSRQSAQLKSLGVNSTDADKKSALGSIDGSDFQGPDVGSTIQISTGTSRVTNGAELMMLSRTKRNLEVSPLVPTRDQLIGNLIPKFATKPSFKSNFKKPLGKWVQNAIKGAGFKRSTTMVSNKGPIMVKSPEALKLESPLGFQGGVVFDADATPKSKPKET
jgi:CRP-like cAMP-binding protein